MAHFLQEASGKAGVVCVDILGPIIDAFKQASHIEPKQEPGLLRKIDEMYYRGWRP
jgi:regulator of PEP synthase PpsR (kinase-PPPase family)